MPPRRAGVPGSHSSRLAGKTGHPDRSEAGRKRLTQRGLADSEGEASLAPAYFWAPGPGRPSEPCGMLAQASATGCSLEPTALHRRGARGAPALSSSSSRLAGQGAWREDCFRAQAGAPSGVLFASPGVRVRAHCAPACWLSPAAAARRSEQRRHSSAGIGDVDGFPDGQEEDRPTGEIVNQAVRPAPRVRASPSSAPGRP